ncbi:hypothetical protein [Actinoplanes auranticolor]|uniref:Uncharacterized protein n=1 Tax=Actinoplanes auranticolor TaxID=47988 RepID=A0A919SVC4_9ACTN|nr:hypothetical protein [Actinoplanes auranticolor]GIM78334.1 hypothetical protein Aau02nite_80320 [Actinoplanes auranticolor]
MTMWRKARTEVAGAWRSVRYDLDRPEPDAGEPEAGVRSVRPSAGHPDVTSTGLSTFGGAGMTGGLRTSYGEQLVPRPRRIVAASAFGVLAVAGAAGSYFAVVNGIGALVGEKPAGAEPYPLAAEAPRGSEGDLSNSGLGRGTAYAAGGRPPAAATTAAEPVPGTIRVLPPTVGAAAPAAPPPIVPQPPRTTSAGRPETRPADCCAAPPVPTPTAPVPTPHSPSATPSPTSSSPDGSGSPEPSESPVPAEPTGSDDATGPDRDENRARHARQH